MSDLAVRISLFLSRGIICQDCGVEIQGEPSGSPRCCDRCRPVTVRQLESPVEQQAPELCEALH
jgi:hypothetical protein